jgi:hypothetical protein
MKNTASITLAGSNISSIVDAKGNPVMVQDYTEKLGPNASKIALKFNTTFTDSQDLAKSLKERFTRVFNKKPRNFISIFFEKDYGPVINDYAFTLFAWRTDAHLFVRDITNAEAPLKEEAKKFLTSRTDATFNATAFDRLMRRLFEKYDDFGPDDMKTFMLQHTKQTGGTTPYSVLYNLFIDPRLYRDVVSSCQFHYRKNFLFSLSLTISLSGTSPF